LEDVLHWWSLWNFHMFCCSEFSCCVLKNPCDWCLNLDEITQDAHEEKPPWYATMTEDVLYPFEYSFIVILKHNHESNIK
jgi:hypothetical protein